MQAEAPDPARDASSEPLTETAIRPTGEASKGYLQVFRNFVEKDEVLREIEAAFFDGVETFAGRACREHCERDGLALIHLHFPYEHLKMLEPFVMDRVKERMLRWAAKMGRETLGLTEEFFVQDLLLLRINYPFTHQGTTPDESQAPALRHRVSYGLRNLAASTHAALRSGSILGRPRELVSYYLKRGQVKGVAYRGHPNHLDSWFGQPIGSLSVWLAIAGVDRANAMCLYPETDGLRIPQNDALYLGTGFLLPEPTRPDLSDGDLLVFTTDMLHCTQLNPTDKTRIALSIRVSAQTPRYDEANLWFIEEWHSSADLTRNEIKKPGSCGSRRVPTAAPVEAPWPQTKSLSVDAPYARGTKQAVAPSDTLADGEKIAVQFEDERFLVLRTKSGLRAYFGTCPHADYRLADGHHDASTLTCPGHGLEFDIETGESKLPCFNLKKVEVYEEEGTIFLA